MAKLTEEEKILEKLKADMAKLGINPEVFDNAMSEVVDSKDEIALEAETVLFYYSTKGQGFIEQQCPVCLLTFAYYYRATRGPGMKCSNACRKQALALINIKWSPTKPPGQRYELAQGEDEPFNIPATLPPEALAVVKEALRKNGD